MDFAKKKAGRPESLSRAEKKANKRNTSKKRRREDRMKADLLADMRKMVTA